MNDLELVGELQDLVSEVTFMLATGARDTARAVLGRLADRADAARTEMAIASSPDAAERVDPGFCATCGAECISDPMPGAQVRHRRDDGSICGPVMHWPEIDGDRRTA